MKVDPPAELKVWISEFLKTSLTDQSFEAFAAWLKETKNEEIHGVFKSDYEELLAELKNPSPQATIAEEAAIEPQPNSESSSVKESALADPIL